jgi:hypothetical protein
MKPSLYFELPTAFSENVYQGIEWFADEDAKEGGSVRLNINPDLPWSPSGLAKLAEALTRTARALRVQRPDWRRRRLVRDVGFKVPPQALREELSKARGANTGGAPRTGSAQRSKRKPKE